MIKAAQVALRADRWTPYAYVVRFDGVDLTGASLHAQVRLSPDAAGAPLIDLPQVGGASDQGVRLMRVDSSGAAPASYIRIQIPGASLGAAIPAGDEQGDVCGLTWDLIVTLPGRTQARWLQGSFTVDPGTTQLAPAALADDPPPGTADAVYAVDVEALTVSISGADMLAPMYETALAASDLAHGASLTAVAKAAAASSAAEATGGYLTAVQAVLGQLPTGTLLPLQASSRAVLTMMATPTLGAQAWLGEPGREGTFVWRGGNYDGKVAADRAQAIYIASNSVPASQGCWVRAALGPMMTSWFGVIHDAETTRDTYNPAATDNTVAMQAASDLATALMRPLLLSPGAVMWDSVSFVYSFSLRGGGKDRGSTLYQKPGSAGSFLKMGYGIASDVSITDLFIRCNGVPGAHGLDFTAHGDANATGGLWYFTIARIQIENVGGVGLRFWTGDTPGDYVNQFGSVSNIIIHRALADENSSRALSVAGRLAQCTFRDCEFDAAGNANPRDGCNVAWGPRYPEGDVYSRMIATSSSDPIAAGPAVNTFEGTTTIQGDRYGMYVGSTDALTLDTFWFEGLERALTITGAAQVTCRRLRFANAASDQIDNGHAIGSGYGIGKDASSIVSVSGCEWYGAIDPVSGNGGGAIRSLPGSAGGGWIIGADNVLTTWDGYTFGITPSAYIAGGVLRGFGFPGEAMLLPGSAVASMPDTFIDIEANVLPGTYRFRLTGHVFWRADAGKKTDLGGSLRLRPGDVLEIIVADSGTRYTANARLRPFGQNTVPNPECQNTAPTLAAGKFLDRWRCLSDASIVPVYEATS